MAAQSQDRDWHEKTKTRVAEHIDAEGCCVSVLDDNLLDQRSERSYSRCGHPQSQCGWRGTGGRSGGEKKYFCAAVGKPLSGASTMRNVRSKKCTRRSTRHASRHTRSWKIARVSCSSKGKMGSTGRSCESKLSSQTTGRTEERNTAALAARRSGYQTSGSVALLGVALPSGHVPQTKAHRCIHALRAPHIGD